MDTNTDKIRCLIAILLFRKVYLIAIYLIAILLFIMVRKKSYTNSNKVRFHQDSFTGHVLPFNATNGWWET